MSFEERDVREAFLFHSYLFEHCSSNIILKLLIRYPLRYFPNTTNKT